MEKEAPKKQLSNEEIEIYIKYMRKEITQAEAYLLVYPGAQENTARSHGYEIIQDIADRLPKDFLRKYYRLGLERLYYEVDSQLKATRPLSYKGIPTGFEEPDNPTRTAALKVLGQLNGLGDSKRTEITAEGGDQLHIIIDN